MRAAAASMAGFTVPAVTSWPQLGQVARPPRVPAFPMSLRSHRDLAVRIALLERRVAERYTGAAAPFRWQARASLLPPPRSVCAVARGSIPSRPRVGCQLVRKPSAILPISPCLQPWRSLLLLHASVWPSRWANIHSLHEGCGGSITFWSVSFHANEVSVEVEPALGADPCSLRWRDASC